jgi:hypothetical protein
VGIEVEASGEDGDQVRGEEIGGRTARGPVCSMYWIQNVSATSMDEGDAYLPRVHFFVAHAKIMHSMSAREIGGHGWVDDLRMDRDICNPSLKLLAHGISGWRTWWTAERTQ